MKSKKTEETYKLTFKGFITLQYDFNEEKTDKFLDALELFLRRDDKNAVILDLKSGGFITEKVYLEQK